MAVSLKTKLEADELLIGDETGAHLRLDASGMSFWENRATLGALLGLNDGLFSLHLYDTHGQERVELFIEKNGTPNLLLNDGNGKTRLECRVTEDGCASVELQDGEGKRRLILTTDEDDNTPRLILHDSADRERLELTLNPYNAPSFTLRDKTGQGTRWVPGQTTEED